MNLSLFNNPARELPAVYYHATFKDERTLTRLGGQYLERPVHLPPLVRFDREDGYLQIDVMNGAAYAAGAAHWRASKAAAETVLGVMLPAPMFSVLHHGKLLCQFADDQSAASVYYSALERGERGLRLMQHAEDEDPAKGFVMVCALSEQELMAELAALMP